MVPQVQMGLSDREHIMPFANFQRDHGLTVDGVIGPTTRSKINSAYSNLGGSSSGTNLSMGSSGTDVKNMQQKTYCFRVQLWFLWRRWKFLDREHITLFANFRKQMVYPLTELLDLLLGRKLMLYMQNCKMDIR